MKTHRAECRSENDFHDDLMRKFRICALNKFPSTRETQNALDGGVETPAEMSQKHSSVSLLLNNSHADRRRDQHPFDENVCQLCSSAVLSHGLHKAGKAIPWSVSNNKRSDAEELPRQSTYTLLISASTLKPQLLRTAESSAYLARLLFHSGLFSNDLFHPLNLSVAVSLNKVWHNETRIVFFSASEKDGREDEVFFSSAYSLRNQKNDFDDKKPWSEWRRQEEQGSILWSIET